MARMRHGYHATTASSIPGIARDGLLPNDGSRGIWPDELPVIGFLFLCDTLDGARYYQEQLRSSEPSFILRFPKPEDAETDPHGDMMGETRSPTAVDRSAIHIEIDGGWTPLAGLDLSFLDE